MRAEKLLKRLSKEEGIEEEEPKEIPEEEEPMEETSDMAPPTQGLMSRVAQ
jgi:hypothetical protein